MTKIVHSLLAIAFSSSVLLAQANGWSGGPGKGLSFDGGELFSFKIDNHLQTLYAFAANEFDADRSTFDILRARTAFTGHVYKKSIRYVLRLDAADTPGRGGGSLKDGHVTWNFVDDDSDKVGLRMGQGKTQYGLEATGSSKGLFFVGRSTAARSFSNVRSTGAWFMGAHRDNSLRWSAGAMNGATALGLLGATDDGGTIPNITSSGYIDVGEEAANSDNELSYVITASFDPVGDTLDGKGNSSFRQGDFREGDRSLRGTFGAGIGLENGKDASSGSDVESIAINLNTVWSANGFQIIGEYFMRNDEGITANGPVAAPTSFTNDQENSNAWAVSGSYVLPKSGESDIQWGFGARVSMVENDRGNDGKVDYLGRLAGIGTTPGNATEISLVCNAFYHGHACKTQFEYTLQQVNPTAGPDESNHIVRILFQILF